MIVTIDGPAGAGKSSIARQVAERLGFEFLDTGAMYRAVTLGAIRRGIELTDVNEVRKYAASATLEWKNNRVWLGGEDVSDDIRNPIVTDAIRHVADVSEVREQLSEHQRRIATDRRIVTEGRDQGTEVFPNAACKVFLTASPEERAKRRQQQLADAGRFLPIDDILATQNQRDLEDRMRPVGRLRAADDAVVVHSDGLTLDQVLERVLEVVQSAVAAQHN